MRISRFTAGIALIQLILASLVVFILHEQPGFTDAFYHYNAAVRLAKGDGFVDDYLWTYIGQPSTLPAPSHLYWMPGTSILAALGMMVFGISYSAAQVMLVLCLWGASLLAYWMARRWTGKVSYAVYCGLATIGAGFFMRFWGTTDTFAPYALVGGMALSGLGSLLERDDTPIWRWGLAGGLCALGHLIRSDGLLLILVGCVVLLADFRRRGWRRAGQALIGLITGYLLVMSPWFVRNMQAVDSILPVGGTQSAWYRTYDDLFSYPPYATPADLFADGLQAFVESRWYGLTNNLGTFIAVEGFVILMPFMLLALWRWRTERFWWPVAFFAVGIHAAFTFVFPFPGVRGGLLHAVAALVPAWLVLGFAGLDFAVEWIAKRRRHWRAGTAQHVFAAGVFILILGLGISIAAPNRVGTGVPGLYTELKQVVPASARIMINDPAQLYFFTNLGGVVLPNEDVAIVPEIAQRYGVDYLLIELIAGRPAVPAPFLFDLEAPPAFLLPVPLNRQDVKLYAIQDTP